MEDIRKEEDIRLFEPRCKLCRSPNRKIYEKLREEGKDYTVILEEAKRLNENISRMNLSLHFRKHYSKLIERALDSKLLAKSEVEKKVKETLDLVEELRSNISLIKTMVNNLVGGEEELTFSKISIVKALLAEIRLTATTLGTLTQKLRITTGTEEWEKERQLFQQALKRIDPETAKHIYLVMKELEDESKSE